MTPSAATDLDCLRRAWSTEWTASTPALQDVLDRMSDATASILRAATSSQPIPACDPDLLALTFLEIETHYANGGSVLGDLPDVFADLRVSPLDRALIALRATALSNTINQTSFLDALPDQVTAQDLAQAAASAPVLTIEPKPGTHFISFDPGSLTASAVQASADDDDLDAIIATQTTRFPHPALLHFTFHVFLDQHETDCQRLVAMPPPPLARWLLDRFDLCFASAHTLSLRLLALGRAILDDLDLAARLLDPRRSYELCRAAAALPLHAPAGSPAPIRLDPTDLRTLLASCARPQ